LAAAALGLLLGAFGAHRFYLGYTTIGVCQVLVTLTTFGAGCLWGVLEGGLILAGRFTVDASGRQLAFGVPSQTVVAVAGSGLAHFALVAGGWWLAAIGYIEFTPPPAGKQSINLSAQIAQQGGGRPHEPPPPLLEIAAPTTPPTIIPPSRAVTVAAVVSPRGDVRVAPADVTTPEAESSQVAPHEVQRAEDPPDMPAESTPPATLTRTKSHRAPAVNTEIDAPAAPATAAASASVAESGAKVDTLPQKTFSPSPAYPPAALAARLTGRVIVRIKVSATGAVESALIHRSSGHRSLDEAALAAVRRWRFEPARRLGIPVATEVAAPIRFDVGGMK